jgi:putative oxidoreductase
MYKKICQLLDIFEGNLSWFPALFGRVSVGLLFLLSGIGKLSGIHDVADYFGQLGIPAPLFSAWVVSLSETVCGGLLVIGLLTRLSAIPLVVDMSVAIVTAKKENIHGLVNVLGFPEYLFIVVLTGLVILGPGPVSLDYFIYRFLGKRDRPSKFQPQRLAG